jgi:electron transfer flavoprotein alpha subunit
VACAAYLTDVEYRDGHFQFSKIISGGTQVVQPTTLPVVLTVAKYEYPLFAAFGATRRANATKVIVWGANDIQASQIGAKGSKTQVIRVFPPGKTTRKCQRLENASELAKIITKSYVGGESHAAAKAAGPTYLLPGKRANPFDRSFEWIEKDRSSFKMVADQLEAAGVHDSYDLDEEVKEKLAAALGPQFAGKALDEMLEGLRTFEPGYRGPVFIMAEHAQGAVSPATLELTGKARELADSLGVEVGVVLAGESVASLAPDLIKGGADKVHLVEHPSLKDFDPVSYRKAVTEIVAANWPQIMLFAATPAGRVLAPMVSYRLGCGLTADCTSLDIKDNSRKGQIGILLQTRPALGGNVMATICTKDSRCQMATARPGVLKKLPPDSNRKGEVIRYQAQIGETDRSLKFIRTEVAQSSNVNLEAEVIVSGGKGLQNRDNYAELLRSLCEALGHKLGTDVEKGASRSAVEQGFTERARQVGQTGTSVGPKLYVALGISGAIQHMIGVAKSETIVAINIDPEAPIFKQCDYYMVGNVEKVVPELVKALGAA